MLAFLLSLGLILAAGAPDEEQLAELRRSVAESFWKDWKPLSLEDPKAASLKPLVSDMLAALEKRDPKLIEKEVDGAKALKQIERDGQFEITKPEQRLFVEKRTQQVVPSYLMAAYPNEEDIDFRLSQILMSPDESKAILFFQSPFVNWDCIETTFGVVAEKEAAGWRIVNLVSVNAKMTSAKYIAPSITKAWDKELKEIIELHKVANYCIKNRNYPVLSECYDRIHELKVPPTEEVAKFLLLGQIAFHLQNYDNAWTIFSTFGTYSLDALVADYYAARVANDWGKPDEALYYANRFLKTVGPNGQTLFEQGRAHQLKGDTERALASFRAGLEANPGSVANLIALSQSLPPEEQKEVVDFYTKGQKYFDADALMQSLDEAECYPAMLALAAAERKRDPESWFPDAYEGRALFNQKQYAQAAPLLERAINRMPKEERDAAGWQFIYLGSMRSLDKVVEGFEKCPDKESALVSVVVAGDLMPPKDLAAIIAIAEKENPKPAALEVARAVYAMRMDQHEEADRLFTEVVRKGATGNEALDEAIDSYLRWWLSIRFHLKTADDAMALSPQNGRLFQELARLYYDQNMTQKLSNLVKVYRKTQKEDPNLAYWDGRLAESRGDTHAAQDEYEKALSKPLSEYAENNARFGLLRMLLKNGDFESALDFANQWVAFGADPYFLVVAASGCRDSDAEPRLRSVIEWYLAQGNSPESIYRLPEVSKALQDPLFQKLREKYPEPERKEGPSPTLMNRRIMGQ